MEKILLCQTIFYKVIFYLITRY